MQKKYFSIFLSMLFLSSFCLPSFTFEKENRGSINSSQEITTDEMVMVFIPGDDYTIGSEYTDPLVEDDEKPAHTVKLDAFWMDKTEVSNRMFVKFLNAGNYTQYNSVAILDSTQGGIYFEKGEWQVKNRLEDYPAVYISWSGANSYCAWTGRRLPSEAEWEAAARGINDFLYPVGDELSCDTANYKTCGGFVLPVNVLQAGENPYGLTGMAGNVWEWNLDMYSPDYYKKSEDVNPFGPVSALNFHGANYGAVIRGGCFEDKEGSLRAANRAFKDRTAFSEIIGFRCVLPTNH